MDSHNTLDYKKLSTAGIIFLSLTSLLVLVITIGLIRSWSTNHINYTQDTPPEITVSGTGDVLAVPDTAVFTFSVIEDAKTVQDAQKMATDLTNKALAYLKTAGIADTDIQTFSYDITPQYSTTQVETYSSGSISGSGVASSAIAPQPARCIGCPITTTQTIIGYEVNQSVQVKVRKTDQAGTILAGIGGLGVKNISGLNLTIDDQNAVNEQAREKAIADAKTQAETLAHDLGVHLGEIISFSDQGSAYPMAYAKALSSGVASSASAPEIPVGQNKVTANVTITFEIR